MGQNKPNTLYNTIYSNYLIFVPGSFPVAYCRSRESWKWCLRPSVIWFGRNILFSPVNFINAMHQFIDLN